MFDRVLDQDATLDALRPILTDPTKEKVGQNLKYDMLVLQRARRRRWPGRSPTRWS